MVPQIGLQCGMVLHELLVIHQRRILAQLLGGFAVSVQELIEARQFFAVGAIAIVLAVIVAIFLPHEGVRIFLYLLANCRMLLQIGLKLRMVSDVFLVIHEGRIFAKLLGSFAVTIQELIEAREVLAIDIAIAIVLAAIVAIFLPHEGVRILPDLVTNLRMVLQIGLERRMPLHKVVVVYERRILANISGEFGMAVQKLIEARQFLTRGVVVLHRRSIPSGRGLRIGGCANPEKSRECWQYQQVLVA